MNLYNKNNNSGHQIQDLQRLGKALDVNLAAALSDLRQIFAELNQRIEAHASGYDLPCHAGCSACCNVAVRVSFLEYVAVVEALRKKELLADFVRRALALDGDLPAQRCPALSESGLCLAYASRPLVCRLFGLSFNEQGGLYACDMAGAQLAGQTLRLPRAQAVLQQVRALPLTEKIDTMAAFALMLRG